MLVDIDSKVLAVYTSDVLKYGTFPNRIFGVAHLMRGTKLLGPVIMIDRVQDVLFEEQSEGPTSLGHDGPMMLRNLV